MFEKLTQEPYLSEYSVEILSSPATGGPWVITMEDVVSQEEADRLIQLGAEEGYARSADVGKMKADGTSESDVNTGRTSHNAWCVGPCYVSYFKIPPHKYTLSMSIPTLTLSFYRIVHYLVLD